MTDDDIALKKFYIKRSFQVVDISSTLTDKFPLSIGCRISNLR